MREIQKDMGFIAFDSHFALPQPDPDIHPVECARRTLKYLQPWRIKKIATSPRVTALLGIFVLDKKLTG